MFAQVFLKGEILQHLGGLLKMTQAGVGLGRGGQTLGRAHFLADGIGHVVVVFLVSGDATLQQVDTLLPRAEAVALERRLGCRNSTVDVVFGAQGNLCTDFLSGRIDNVEILRRCRVDPFTIDVKLSVIAH